VDLKELAKLGAFIDTQTVEVPVEWEGNHMTAHFRRLSFGDYEAIAQMPEDRSRSATIISKTLFLPDVARLMTYEEAYQLAPKFAEALVKAMTEGKVLVSPKA
jgi:hypothetical protein